MDFPALPNLSKKVGPLPLSAWIAVIGLGLTAAYLLRNRAASAAPATAVEGEGLAYSDPLGGPSGTAAGGYGLAPVTPISTPDGVPQSNAEWINKAAKTMQVLRRPWSPSAVMNALTRYVNGKSLDATQRQIVDDALRQTGYPPEAIVPEPDPTPTAPAPGTTGTPGYERTPPDLVAKGKLGTRRTTVLNVAGKGETAEQISRRVYSSARFANTLDYVNGSIASPYNRPLPVGMTVAY